MGIEKIIASTSADLIKNENIQNKVTSLLGMLFPYAGIEKRALDMYVSDVEKSDMSPESKLIAVLNAKETIKRLKNQKSIADNAVSNAKEDTTFDSSSGVDQEWLERFMNSAGFVSDEDIQLIWGKILANEFETPGSTPLNMIRILSEITPKYAEAFQKICAMKRILVVIDNNGKIITIREDIVVPFIGNENEMRDINLSLEIFSELETLGLIKFNTNGYSITNISEKCIITYIDGFTKEIISHRKDTLPLGNVLLTESGKCLKKIIQTEAIANFEIMEKKYMTANGVEFKESTEYNITDNGKGELTLDKNLK